MPIEKSCIKVTCVNYTGCFVGIKLLDHPEQRLICVDRDGRETGRVVDRKTAHTAPGVKHLAIQILVFSPKKELILHERPKKKVGGNVLDAPTTHVLAGETPKEAAARCLKNEYGIVDKLKIKILSGFSYEKEYGNGSCENEFCLAAFVEYAGKLQPNTEEAAKIVILPVGKVISELVYSPEIYPVWLKETMIRVKADPEAGKYFS